MASLIKHSWCFFVWRVPKCQTFTGRQWPILLGIMPIQNIQPSLRSDQTYLLLKFPAIWRRVRSALAVDWFGLRARCWLLYTALPSRPRHPRLFFPFHSNFHVASFNLFPTLTDQFVSNVTRNWFETSTWHPKRDYEGGPVCRGE